MQCFVFVEFSFGFETVLAPFEVEHVTSDDIEVNLFYYFLKNVYFFGKFLEEKISNTYFEI